MGGPIHLFQVRSAFTEEYTNHYFEPWLSYTEDTQDIDYNKPKGQITVLPEPTANLAYDGTSKNLITAGSGTGTMMYKLGDGEWSTSIPQATTAGTYTVYYKTAESDYYHESEVYSMSVTLEKATPTVVVPTPIALVYNGSAQTLANAGSTDYGTIQYSLNNSTWSTSIPTATNSGTYSLYYRVVGNANVNDVPSTSVNCSIAEKVIYTPTIELSQSTYSYDGSACEPSVTVKDGSTVISPSEYVVSYSNNTNAGTATVIISDTHDAGNYYVTGTTTFTINKASGNVTTAPTAKSGLVYDGSAQNLVNAGSGTGTMMYKVGNGEWSSNVPVETNAGNYTIYYKAAESTNYTESTTGSVSVSIAKAAGSVTTAPTPKTGLTYNGNSQTLANAGSGTGEMVYSLNPSTWTSFIPVGTNASSYTVYYKAVESSNYTESPSGSIIVNIAKAAPTYTAPTTKTGLTYTGNAQALLNAGSTNHGTIQYSSDNSTWSTAIPSGTNATSYTVYWKLVGDSNHNNVASTSVSASIAKANPTYTAPTAKTGLTYNGSSQTLLNAGSTSHGTIQYSSNNSTWSTNIPSGTNATSYTSYWRLVGDSNHTDVASTSISTSIAKANPTYTAPTAKTGLTYNGNAQALLNAGSTSHGTIQYSSDNSTWSTAIPSGTNVTSYTSYWKLVGDSNHNNVASTSINTTIGKATGSVTTAPVNGNPTYGSGSYVCTTGAGTGTMMYRLGTSGSFSSTRPTTSGLNAGTYTLYYYAAESTNYSQSPTGSISVTVARAERTMSWASQPDKVVCGETATATASRTGDGAISYSSNNTSIAIINSNSGLITGVNTGTCTITASVSQTTNYNAKSISYTLTVGGYEIEYLTFEITSPGNIIWQSDVWGETPGDMVIQYKKNNGSWTNITATTAGTQISVVSGDTVQFRGDNASYQDDSCTAFFSGCTCGFKLKGNIMSMINSTGFVNETAFVELYPFCAFFQYCTGLTDASNLVLPATGLTESCYSAMFAGCTNLTAAPSILPATSLANYCYNSMFSDCTSLTTAPELPATTLADYCYDSMFYGCTNLTTAPELPATAVTTCCYRCMFYWCFSLATAPELPATVLANSCYTQMFYSCSNLTAAPSILPATTLARYCYQQMFFGCTSLTTAPILPATALTNYCYNLMFRNCTSLNYIKCLAKTNVNSNYSTNNWVNGVATAGTFVKADGFTGWPIGNNGIPTSWVTVDEIVTTPLTFEIVSSGTIVWKAISTAYTVTLEYKKNDGNWTTITSNTGNSAPQISVVAGDNIEFRGNNETMSSGNGRYNTFSGSTAWFNLRGNIMSLLDSSNFINKVNLSRTYTFYNLFTLTNAVNANGLYLLATNINSYCYDRMFYKCTNLVTSPTKLPAQSVDSYCYAEMFAGCTSLTTAPELPATSLANYCYSSMFNGCTSLTTAPELPATSLTNYCYTNMFNGCTSLTTAPELPATSLAGRCYNQMFQGCTNLTTAPDLLATELTSYCYNQMFYGCTSLNYIKCLATTNVTTGNTTNWVANVAASGTFVKADNFAGWTIGNNGIPTNWVTVENSLASPLTFEITSNGYVYWRRNGSVSSKTIQYKKNNGIWTNLSPTTAGTAISVASGDTIQFRGDNTQYGTSLTSFHDFSKSTCRFKAKGNIMSLVNSTGFTTATTLQNSYTFIKLFSLCSAITDASELVLPAETLTNYCYYMMFQSCGNLVNGPSLIGNSATTMGQQSCYSMFRYCTGLTAAPELPATTLAESCYLLMFDSCTTLTTASYIGNSSTTLAVSACCGMFQGCISLTTPPALPAKTLANYCYADMFSGCTSLTTAPALPATTLADYCYYRMFFKCTSLTTAPELPATTLAQYCYYYMFYNCTGLNYIKCLATNISAYNCTYNWVDGVASTGRFVKNSNMSSWTTGISGIPTGWTVQNAT